MKLVAHSVTKFGASLISSESVFSLERQASDHNPNLCEFWVKVASAFTKSFLHCWFWERNEWVSISGLPTTICLPKYFK